MHDFHRLDVWKLSRELAVELHVRTRRFPASDRGVIGGQLRRSALSIPANIAEGCGKSARAETIRFLEIASGSAAETEHHLLVACEVGYIPEANGKDYVERIQRIQRMLHSLRKKLPE